MIFPVYEQTAHALCLLHHWAGAALETPLFFLHLPALRLEQVPYGESLLFCPPEQGLAVLVVVYDASQLPQPLGLLGQEPVVLAVSYAAARPAQPLALPQLASCIPGPCGKRYQQLQGELDPSNQQVRSATIHLSPPLLGPVGMPPFL